MDNVASMFIVSHIISIMVPNLNILWFYTIVIILLATIHAISIMAQLLTTPEICIGGTGT